MGIPYAEVIGDPIEHSKSPLIHKFWLEELGLAGDFRATRVESSELAGFLERRITDRDWRGCNVTIPHKTAAAGLAYQLVGPASAVGAVNCLVKSGNFEPVLYGHNSDVAGVIGPLRKFDVVRGGYRFAHVVGTGGAAAAATFALGRLGFTVFNYGRTREKAQALRDRVGEEDDDFALDLDDLYRSGSLCTASEASVVELLVNATPMGMNGYPPLGLDLGSWDTHTIVYDLVYAPLETPLLADARARGMETIDGLHMLVGQAAAAFELFFHRPAPREHDAALRGLLIR